MVEELTVEQQEVRHSCRVLMISTSGYYSWLKRPQSTRKSEDERLWQKIKKHWESSRKTYGRARITDRLNDEGERVGKNRVARLMKENGIQGVGKKKFKPQTTTSNHNFPVAPRLFKIESAKEQLTKPNQYWGGDLTYIPTEEGWLYLSVFIDLFTKKIVGHSMSDSMRAEVVTDSIDMALQRQGIEKGSGLTAHTDRGSQYAGGDFKGRLEAFEIIQSMSRKGNCYDNSIVESFFRTIKVELVYRQKFKTREEAKAAIFEFIEVWYNRQRIHSSLDYMTPEEYELKQLNAA